LQSTAPGSNHHQHTSQHESSKIILNEIVMSEATRKV